MGQLELLYEIVTGHDMDSKKTEKLTNILPTQDPVSCPTFNAYPIVRTKAQSQAGGGRFTEARPKEGEPRSALMGMPVSDAQSCLIPNLTGWRAVPGS